MFFHHQPKQKARRTGSLAWVNESKAVIMLLPHRPKGDRQRQRGTVRSERRGLHFRGRGVHMEDVLVLQGRDVNSGFKARRYQLLENFSPPAVLSAIERPERDKKARRGEEGGSSGAATGRDLMPCQFETGALDIRNITRSEASSMQVIRQALSQFDDRKKIELLLKALNEIDHC